MQSISSDITKLTCKLMSAAYNNLVYGNSVILPLVVSRANSAGSSGIVSFELGWVSGGAAAAGVFLVAAIGSNTGTAATISGGSTWILLNNIYGHSVYYKVAGGSEPSSYTITYNGVGIKDGATASIIEIENCNATNPDASASSTYTVTNPSAISTNVDDLSVICFAGGGTAPIAPSGYTINTSISDFPNGVGTTIANKVNVGSGSISPGDWSLPATNASTILVKP